ncbi:ribonuclease E activity regulator RraA [Bacillus sp. 1P06AnD]|uniref:ribonuclease E activity regulator RraA n=1 Tax=Bacillus sp. 1P06AnD TaxID=3132208 RepID=UPI0039A1F027
MKNADICDRFIERVSICEQEFHTYGNRKSFSGPIETVRVFEDNVLVVKALESIPEGSVLVVDGGGSKKCALMGDRLAGIAVTRNLAGVIIYGCIRDCAEIDEMDLGVRALGTNPKKSRKDGKGHRNICLYFGGIEWHAGDYAYCDEDGILVAKEKLPEIE